MASAADVPRARRDFRVVDAADVLRNLSIYHRWKRGASARRASVVTRAPPPYLHTAME